MERLCLTTTALAITAVTAFACGRKTVAPPPPPVQTQSRAVSFLDDVKPVLDKRCVVCHSCYNAACQLKMSAFEGLDRGGSKQSVYDSSRLTPQRPTRLFIDALSTAGWRKLDFHSVTASTAAGNDSIMAYFLDAKRRQPLPAGEYKAEGKVECAANTKEASEFLGEHPDRGMPFGFPALTDEEHDILTRWINQGARGPSSVEQKALVAPSAAATVEIARWESFFNGKGPKHAMTARYIYEHLFLAHLRFSQTGEQEFFELVRSTTPSGQPIDLIPTIRPYDNPGVDRVYYRFRKIHSTVVYKTHMVVEFDDRTLARYRELFIATEWDETPHEVAFDTTTGANPFLTYAQIPPRARYQFLLDNSEYIIRAFMQGPVCKGQVALNVINDHFWALFLDPSADQTVQNPKFLIAQATNLRIPNERGSHLGLVYAGGNKYRDKYTEFYKAKNALYATKAPTGFSLDALWRGERAEDSPVLTIYRHFDSASVHRGPIGELPRTLWVIDYPQFERIYYSLVAGFDVFGNVAHQSSVRRYMDYLRIEGELNFLAFMPPARRATMLKSWYVGKGAFETTRPEQVIANWPTQIRYTTQDPKRELVEKLVNDRLPPDAGIQFDPINYHGDDAPPPMPKSFKTHDDIAQGFRALTAPGTGFIRYATGSQANVLYVRVKMTDGEDKFFCIVINRWHDNVSTMFGEKDTLNPTKDTIDFHPRAVGAYPNYFLVVSESNLPDFFDMLQNFDDTPAYRTKFQKYGVNRADPKFWQVYDWFQQRLRDDEPITGGLLDLNRYYSRTSIE